VTNKVAFQSEKHVLKTVFVEGLQIKRASVRISAIRPLNSRGFHEKQRACTDMSVLKASEKTGFSEGL
jgi:hypothetical protein